MDACAVILATLLPHWLWHPLGQCAGTHAELIRCRSYNFWSGSASDISEITLIGIAVGVYKQHTCRAHWWCPCWATHKVKGTTASVCHFHHSTEHHEKLQARHQRRHPDRLGHGDSP